MIFDTGFFLVDTLYRDEEILYSAAILYIFFSAAPFSFLRSIVCLFLLFVSFAKDLSVLLAINF